MTANDINHCKMVEQNKKVDSTDVIRIFGRLQNEISTFFGVIGQNFVKRNFVLSSTISSIQFRSIKENDLNATCTAAIG